MWVYGTHAVVAALNNPKRKVTRICVTGNEAENIRSAIDKARHPKWDIVDNKQLASLLKHDAVHQGVAIEVEPLPSVSLDEVLAGAETPVVILDQITDPHNVGAILHSAAAFDACAIVMQDRHSPALGGALAKAACGAVECVPIIEVNNIAKALDRIKQANYWVAGLDGNTDTEFGNAKLDKKTALVLGAEGKGLRRLVREHCDVLVRLPLSEKMESLNVSNAAAVALYALYSSS